MNEFDLRDDRFARHSGGGLLLLLGRAQGDIASGATGDVKRLRGAKGAESLASGGVVSVYNRHGALKLNDLVLYAEVNGSGFETVAPTFPEVKIGKADAAIAKGASGLVSIWEGEPGSETDTGENVTGYAKARAITSGKFVSVTRFPGRTGWYVDCYES